MIDIRYWRRRQPGSWLLVRPDEAGWSWLQVRAGEVLRAGHGQPPEGAGRVALVVPGSECAHFHLQAPPGLKREEWPLLLEDRVLQPAEAIHVGCVSRGSGWLELAVIDRQRLAGWLQACQGWGLQVERCWAEFQLLPELAPGDAWCWRRSPDLSLFKSCGADRRQAWLAWPTALGATPPSVWCDRQVQAFEGAWPASLAALERLPGLFELRRTPRAPPHLAQGQRRLATACAVLGVVWCALWLGLQWRQATLYKAQVVAVTGPLSTPRQATQWLKRERQTRDERNLRLRQLEALQGAMVQWLSAQPGWRLQRARFDGTRWTLQLQGAQAPSDTPWAAMAASAGAQVAVQPATADAVQLVFDLGAGA
ncbi:hypothetical protein MF6396_08750 [Pseudomonas sp. MF6396]|uniref:type II secretion system protein GspL n=1 Tax=Pseudomonas sp. MF6396 TaxID=1960828 RepID=UPI0009CEFDC9|nr:type II secretion system protein GspL [Pseudomonas sp. MF6396]OOW04408.1 hypothetical protein MF6396_08750 [Pseudomonas sp. MF6396]